jgi:hypothetical protein
MTTDEQKWERYEGMDGVFDERWVSVHGAAELLEGDTVRVKGHVAAGFLETWKRITIRACAYEPGWADWRGWLWLRWENFRADTTQVEKLVESKRVTIVGRIGEAIDLRGDLE